MTKAFITKAIIIIAGVALGIVCALVYLNSAKSSTDVSLDYHLEPLPCDLLKNDCSAIYAGQNIVFGISPRPVELMEKSSIRIANLAYSFDDPKIRIYGLNMDMGTIIANLKEVAPHTFEANVALSACLIENVMRYRISVYDGNKPLNLFMDMDIER